MILTTTFKSKGREYSLSLDADKPDRNYDDENYAEWFVTATDGRVLEITVWKDALGRFTPDGTVEIFNDKAAFENGLLLDIRRIRVRKGQEP